MELNEYIKTKYGNKAGWFVEEVATVPNQQRIQNVIANKEYLDGHHEILKRPNFVHNGQVIEPRMIVLNLAKQLINFQVAYLLKNNIQITGVENIAEVFSSVNREGKYNLVNHSILDKLLKFGQCAEYIYLEKGKILSKIIDPSEYTVIRNKHNEVIGLIEHYVWEGVSYYTIYDEEKVQEWNNSNGNLKMSAQHANLTGLPIVYVADDEWGNVEGRSDLEDWKGILDNMEDLLSKYTDSLYTFMNPIPVIVGQQLKGNMPKDVVGGGVNLDDGADFKMVSNQLDHKSFEILYKTLNQSLLDISSTPAVSMNKTDISNLSEVSIKLLFSLADVKAGLNENYMKRGLYERLVKQRTLLAYRGVTMTDEDFYTIDFQFTYNVPMNHKEVIDNLQTLRAIGGISTESMLEMNPYVKDMGMEKERLIDEGVVTSSEVD